MKEKEQKKLTLGWNIKTKHKRELNYDDAILRFSQALTLIGEISVTDEEKFKEVQEAYDILGDAKKRKEYDSGGGIPFGGGNRMA